jgi:hypothetical protein
MSDVYARTNLFRIEFYSFPTFYGWSLTGSCFAQLDDAMGETTPIRIGGVTQYEKEGLSMSAIIFKNKANKFHKGPCCIQFFSELSNQLYRYQSSYVPLLWRFLHRIGG